MRTLVLGMGNDLLSDDAAGLLVARRMARDPHGPNIDVKETSLASLELLDLLAGYDRAFLVDAITTSAGQVGDVHVLTIRDLSIRPSPLSLHHVDLPTVLDLGKRLGLKMPERVLIFAIEAGDISTFGGACSPEVEQAARKVVLLIEAALRELSLTPLDLTPQNHSATFQEAL